VHDIFTSVGATNATWVWCPNVDFTRKLIPLNKVYPGAAYVDWTCLDGFNWGKRADSAGWQTFNQVFHETYKRVLKIAPGKPMVLAEVASNEKGGSKPAWIANMLREVTRYRKIRGLIWFDVKDRNTHWPLESSSKTSRAFAKGIQRTVFRPNEFGGLTTSSPIPPPSWP
jgi:beta-mannanase